MTRIELAIWKHIGKEQSRYAGHFSIEVEFFMREAMIRIGAELLVRRTHIVFQKLRVCMSEAEKERIWNFYVELDEMQRHFNTLQSTYRTLASTWLLAAFAGTGFVVSTELNLAIPRELIIAGIGLRASVGIYLLWVIDLLFYQRLLSAAFQEGQILELRHKWLPQVRNNMRYLMRAKGAYAVRWFYIIATEAMALVGGVGLILWLLATTIPYAVVFVITIAYVIGMGVILLHMRLRNPTPTPYVPRLQRALEQADSERES